MVGELRSARAASVDFVGVSKRYGPNAIAVDRLDLTVRAGEFLTLLGPSGSGKTTALNLLAGFQQPTDGKILLDGIDISAVAPHRRNIGVVFQHYALFPHMTVRENIHYPLKQRRVPKDEAIRRVQDALRMVSLEALADRLPRQLSGGQQQRVAVARATVFGPPLLLMDEPLGALDRKLREAVQLELKHLHRELGSSVVFVTHDQEEALVMSDRIAVFDAGRIRQVGSATELYDAPDNQFVAQFLGQSNCWVGEVGALEATITAVSGTGWHLRGLITPTTPASGPAALVVRPERCVAVAGGTAPAGWNAVPGRMRDVVYLGASKKIVIELAAGATALVVCAPGSVIPPGPEVDVAFPPDAARVVQATTVKAA